MLRPRSRLAAGLAAGLAGLAAGLTLAAAGTGPAAAAPRTGTPDGDGWKVGVFGQRRVQAPAHGGFSRVIYMNDCRPGGCIVVPGTDDSRTNRSSIPQQTSQLDAWPHGDAAWAALVRCVRETYAPFDVQIVTEDPGQANHFEVFVGGDPEDIQLEGALGVAPFVPCGGIIDNVPTFVFANLTDQTDVLCWAVAQETAHAFGLDHVLLRDDPMTYLVPPYRKRFQNQAGACGEELAAPRECWCGGDTQNSYAFLTATFGASELPAPGVTITTPHAGAWVRGGFPVQVALDSLLEMQEVALAVDGTTVAALTAPPFAFNGPAELAPGPHGVRVRAIDQRGLEGEATVAVLALAACGADGACAAGHHCLGGACVPGASEPGGLGATCATGADCGSGSARPPSTTARPARCRATTGAAASSYACIGDSAGCAGRAATQRLRRRRRQARPGDLTLALGLGLGLSALGLRRRRRAARA
ncbi:MAG: Ig-like domain-containing protein [Kofleriaceae bacterium]|nr:Ig-like domain-containing protein [Kofleriaceae bacterium]